MLPRPRLRTILILVNLVVLGVPVLGVAALQIYDTQLLRRTEAEVISQAAHLKAQVEQRVDAAIEQSDYDELPVDVGKAGGVEWPDEFYDFRPIEPSLDSSSDEIYEPEPAPQPPRGGPDPLFERVGQQLEPILEEAQRVTLAGMTVVDWRGDTVASTNESQRGMSLHHRDEIERALDGKVVRMLRAREDIPEGISLESVSRETSNRVFMSMPIVYDDRIVGAVMVWRTPKSLPQALYDNRTLFGLLLALMLLGGLAISGLTAFYIGRPIERLIDQTDQAARDEADGTEPIGKPGTREIQRLSESIAEMASSLQERADYIRTFARSVSHEFKTPLTSIRGTVELLEDHLDEMSHQQRREFLEMLDDDAERLEQLVERLLELAKADVASPNDEGRCDAVGVVEEVADAQRDDQFDVVVDADEMPLEVGIGEEALESVITNLVVNVREHGGSTAVITAGRHDETGEATILVHDDGPGVSEGNIDRIFDEFFTTARDRGGTGLGLSITRALLEAHGGSIRHVPVESGACFEVTVR